jgi:hypothetical protein
MATARYTIHTKVEHYKHKKTTMQKIIATSSLIIGIAILGWATVNAMNSNEVVECNQWQSQASEYSGFYLTHWQADQCKAHNIIINAPIK